jgi:hypothetical protein
VIILSTLLFPPPIGASYVSDKTASTSWISLYRYFFSTPSQSSYLYSSSSIANTKSFDHNYAHFYHLVTLASKLSRSDRYPPNIATN